VGWVCTADWAHGTAFGARLGVAPRPRGKLGGIDSQGHLVHVTVERATILRIEVIPDVPIICPPDRTIPIDELEVFHDLTLRWKKHKRLLHRTVPILVRMRTNQSAGRYEDSAISPLT